jgi:hypothetical protein
VLLALTDHLRCTADHEDSWLVARADIVEAGRMVDGVIGCPVCHVERVVTRGVIYWQGTPPAVARDPAPDAGGERVIRLGALLGFAEGAGAFVLCGADGLAASGLNGLADVPLVLLDPPDDRAAPFATIIRGAPAIPFGAGAVRGIALSSASADDRFMASCLRALAQRGRLVAPAAVPVPAGIRELARDALEWVGEREPVPVTVPLSRAGR